MDDRNGQLYPNRQAALDAGVPADHLQEVEADVFKVTSGPFKGRLYRRTAHGLVRVRVAPRGRPGER